MQQISNKGEHKIKMAVESPIQYLIKAIMAGMLISVAMMLSYSLGALFMDNYAIAKLLIGFTFGVGLLVIIFMRAELFTGNCFTTIITMYNKKGKFSQLLQTWTLCFIGNAIGIIFMCALFMVSQNDNDALHSFMKTASEAKLDYELFPLIAKGVICNFIVCISSYLGYKMKDDTAKVILGMILIAAFYIPAFEHCIANFGTFTMGLMSGANLNFGSMAIHMFITTISNIIGGSLIFGLPIYFMMKKDEEDELAKEKVS